MTDTRDTRIMGRGAVARSRVAILVVILLAIAAGTGGGLWRLSATHQIPAPADRSAGPASAPQLASREPTPAPSPAPSPPKPSMRPAPAPADAKPSDHPSFDIVRVEPKSGDTVVAGRGAPNAQVALMAGSKVVGEARSDANGQFVILPAPLPPGDYALTLRQTPDGAPARESTQSVAVSVPQPGKGKVVVALAEPGKATRLLTAPPGAQTASGPPADGKVAIRSAELENGSGFFVSGAAQPGASVHVYLNDSLIADVVAGADGGWSVRVKKGLTGGHYVVRADVAGAEGRAVASRAEVPFDVPVAMAAAAPTAGVSSPLPSATGATAPAGPAPASTADAKTAGPDATIDTIATARVIIGDNLWNISRYRLGDGKRYTQIYAANSTQIRDPNLIYPGQVFVVPPSH